MNNNTTGPDGADKYPGACLDHFLIMFFFYFDLPSAENYREFILSYVQREGLKVFEELRTEVRLIKANGDIALFLQPGNEYRISAAQLQEMMDVIEQY